MSYFESTIKTLDELKKQYHNLVKKNHPDLGGSEQAMKAINNEYELLYKRIELSLTEDEQKTNYHDLNDGFREFLNSIIHLSDITIDIVGSWVWVQAKPYQHMTELKNAGMNYSAPKKLYYWRKQGFTNKKRSSKMSMMSIKNKYGCTRVDSNQTKQIAG